MYSTDVELAREIATEAHNGMKDKAGVDYILHPGRVADRVSSPEAKVVAWLHDVVEDTRFTIESLASIFGPTTAKAVDAITHREGEKWSDYLIRVKGNEISKEVKIADLIDNSNLGRLKEIKKKDLDRVAKYHRALIFLMDIED